MELFLPEPTIPSWDLVVKRKDAPTTSDGADETHTGAAFLKGGTKKVTDQTWTTHVAIPLYSKASLKDTIVLRIMRQSSMSSRRKLLLEASFAVSDIVSSHIPESVSRNIPDGKGGTIIANFSCELASPKKWLSALRKVKSSESPQGSAEIDAFIKELELLVTDPQHRSKFLQYTSQKSDIVATLFAFLENYAAQLESSHAPASLSTVASPGRESKKGSTKRVSRRQEAVLEQVKTRQEALSHLVTSLLKDAHSRKVILDGDYLQKVIAWACTPGLATLAAAGLASLKPLFATEPQQESLGRAGIIHVLIHLLNPTTTYGSQAPPEVTSMAMQLLPYFSNRFHSVFIKAGVFDCVELLLADSTSPSNFQRGMELMLMVSATKTDEILERFLPVFTGTLARLATKIQDTHTALAKLESPAAQTNLNRALSDVEALLRLAHTNTTFEGFDKPLPVGPMPLEAPIIPVVAPSLILQSLSNRGRTVKKVAPPIGSAMQENYLPPAPPKPLPARDRNANRIDTLSRQVARMLDDPNADPAEIASTLEEIEKLSADDPKDDDAPKTPHKPLSDTPRLPEKILPRPIPSVFVGLVDFDSSSGAGAGDSLPLEMSPSSYQDLDTNPSTTPVAPVEDSESEEEKKPKPVPAPTDSVSESDLDALLSMLDDNTDIQVISRALDRWGSTESPEALDLDLDLDVSSDDETARPKPTNVLRGSRDVGRLMNAMDQLANQFESQSSGTEAQTNVEAALASFAPVPATVAADEPLLGEIVDIPPLAVPAPPPLAVVPQQALAAVLNDIELLIEEPHQADQASQPGTSPRTETSSSTGDLPSSGVHTPSTEDKIALRLQMAELERAVTAPLQPINRLAKGHEDIYLKYDVIGSLVTIMRYCSSSRLKSESQELITRIIADRVYDLNKHNYIDAVLSMAVSACATRPDTLHAPVPSHITQALRSLSTPGLKPSQHQLLEIARLLKIPHSWFSGLTDTLVSAVAKWNDPQLMLLAPPLLHSVVTLASVQTQISFSILQRFVEPLPSDCTDAQRHEQSLLVARLLRDEQFIQHLAQASNISNSQTLVAILKYLLSTPRVALSDIQQYDLFVSKLLTQDLSDPSADVVRYQPTPAGSHAKTIALMDVLEGAIGQWRLTIPAFAATAGNLSAFILQKLLTPAIYDHGLAAKKLEVMVYFKTPYLEKLIRQTPDCLNMIISSDYVYGTFKDVFKLVAGLPGDVIARMVRADFARTVLRKMGDFKNASVPKEETVALFRRLCLDGGLWNWLIHKKEVGDVLQAITNSTPVGDELASLITPDDIQHLPLPFVENILAAMISGTMRHSTISILIPQLVESASFMDRVGVYASTLQDSFVRLLYSDYGRLMRYPKCISDLANELFKSDRGLVLAKKGFFARVFRQLATAPSQCSFGELFDALIAIDAKQDYRLLRVSVAPQRGDAAIISSMPEEAKKLVLNALAQSNTTFANGDWVEIPMQTSLDWASWTTGTPVAVVAYRDGKPVYGGVIPQLPNIESIAPKNNNKTAMIAHLPGVYHVYDSGIRIFYGTDVAKPTVAGSISATLGGSTVQFSGAMSLSFSAFATSTFSVRDYAYNSKIQFSPGAYAGEVERVARYTVVNTDGVTNFSAVATLLIDSNDEERIAKLALVLSDLVHSTGGAHLVDKTAQEVRALFAGTIRENVAEAFYERLCAPGFSVSCSWRPVIGSLTSHQSSEEEGAAGDASVSALQLRSSNCVALYSETRGKSQVVSWDRIQAASDLSSSAPNSETQAPSTTDAPTFIPALTPSGTPAYALPPAGVNPADPSIPAPPPPPPKGYVPPLSSASASTNSNVSDAFRSKASKPPDVPHDITHELTYTHTAISLVRGKEDEVLPDEIALFLSDNPLPESALLAVASQYSSHAGQLNWPLKPISTVWVKASSAADDSALTHHLGLISFPTPLKANHVMIIGLYGPSKKSNSVIISLALLGTAQNSETIVVPRLNHIAKFFAKSTLSCATFVAENTKLEGILYQIGCDFGRRTWQSPLDCGDVHVKLSHKLNAHTMKVGSIIGRDSEVTFWGPGLPCWFQIDLVEYSACPTHFALRHGYAHDNSYICNWRLQASDDADQWVEMFRCEDVTHNGAFDTQLYTLPNPGTHFYRFWRIITLSEYWMPAGGTRNAFLCCSGFDLFGHVVAT